MPSFPGFLAYTLMVLRAAQTYNTGDQSRNNWWVALLAFGEGW